MLSNMLFLLKKWNSLHFLRMELDYLYLKDFLNHVCESYLKQTLKVDTNVMQNHDYTANDRLSH